MSHESISHYSNDVGFFSAFLDPYLKYTSGYFDDGQESLEAATVSMLDKLIHFGKVSSHSRVLDVGSGWGSLLRRLLELHPSVDYVGVNPCAVQNEYVKSQVKSDVCLWQSMFESIPEGGEKFDAIFFVGSFCHLKDKLTQLRKARLLLKAGGVVVIEDSFFLGRELFLKHQNHEKTKFVQQDIFGFAEILAVGDQVEMFNQAGFKLLNSLEHSSSYKKTINIWIDRLEQLDHSRYPFAPTFVEYMNVAQQGWNRTISNYIFTLESFVGQRDSARGRLSEGLKL